MCPTGTALRPEIAESRSDLRSAFDVLDVDHDGKISRDDLRKVYGGGGGASEDVIGEMMTAADSNENGYVEYDEFEGVLELRSNGAMEAAFRVMDRDGDGRVGHEDLKSYLKWAGFHDASDEDINAMIKLGGGDETQGVTFDGLLKILAV
ncbi:calcium-binding protein CP1-like [Rhododendron vialii]|uniref:calcium-binding protein CP1-like n=1 Tax=Rhododendron vialii TaxID=182163 RepID=UPI00265EC53F|nr:calcium-binding protein CP1-like [Rhododendron vialii]